MTPGSLLGQYRILRKLGAGGMGTVYLAEHILLGRKAAIKTLLPTLSVHAEIVDRFFNEARATSAIADAGVVQVFDFGYHVDGTAYIVMELLEGEALADRMARLGALPQADALKIARQVASALAAAHERGIVHRDLKPENIYLVRDAEAQGGERTKILDFGICKLEGDGRLTQSGATLGTPVYMSPEQCRGTGGVDQRSDIYALGCVLFHMLTGRTPFECQGVGEYIVAHLQQQAPAATSLVPGLHPLVDVLLIRCLAKEPDERFQTMRELQDAIGQVMSKISAPGLATATLPAASPVLGEGFRSGNGTVTPAGPPVAETPHGWFVDGEPPDSPDRSYAGESVSRLGLGMSVARTLALGGICLGALVTALFATRAAVGADEPDVPAVATISAPGVASQQVAMSDPPPPAPTDATVAVVIPDTSIAVLSGAVDATRERSVRSRARARAVDRAQVRAARADDGDGTSIQPPGTSARDVKTAAPKPAPPPPAEDLYDTR